MESDRVRFHHVAKHLYQPKERWDYVIPKLVDVRELAWRAGCAETILDAPRPECDRASSSCRAHVLRDHDTLLAPAYIDELSLADQAGRVGNLLDDARGWAFVGDRGVMVIVREVGTPRHPEVKTAYRVIPRRGRQPEDFFKAAVQKLKDKAAWKEGS
jgi:hypothetical protein